MKNKLSKVITTGKIGSRIRYIRENILQVPQIDIAGKIGFHQVLLSRIEQGIGGSVDMLYGLINYFYSNKIAASELFEPSDRVENIQVYKLKTACNKRMDAFVFAERMRFVRSAVLNISQKEFAEQTKTHQPILSRIELGKSSGATDVILNIINFLYSKGIDAKCLFDPLYDIHLLKPEISQLSIDEIIKIQMDAKADLTKALRKMELIEKYLEKINTSE